MLHTLVSLFFIYLFFNFVYDVCGSHRGVADSVFWDVIACVGTVYHFTQHCVSKDLNLVFMFMG